MRDMIYQSSRLNPPEQIANGEYKGFNYYVLNLGIHPCAYVDVTETKLKNVEYDRIDIECHGGLTYSDHKLLTVDKEGWFIGWDYAHAGDYAGYDINFPFITSPGRKWTTQEIVDECKEVIDQLVVLLKENDVPRYGMTNNKYTPSMIIGGDPNKKRNAMDFYPTPREVTVALLDDLSLSKDVKIWEPACGQNHMVDVIREYGYDVIGTDIQDGVDFLTADLPEGVSFIMTNPPFSLSEKFIERCIEHEVSFALLLKSQYWHAKKRTKLFRDYTPDLILPLTWRPDFTGQGSSLLDMMWCVWWHHRPHKYAQYRPLDKPTEDCK